MLNLWQGFISHYINPCLWQTEHNGKNEDSRWVQETENSGKIFSNSSCFNTHETQVSN
jgi:hypothetical protein